MTYGGKISKLSSWAFHDKKLTNAYASNSVEQSRSHKLTVTQLIKKFPVFIVFTTFCHCTLLRGS